MNRQYRWMQDADVAAVAALAERIWRAHYPGIIRAEQIAFMLAKSYTPESLRQQRDQGQRFLLLEVAGALSGFLSMGPLAQVENPLLRGGQPDVGEGDSFLHKFYILPELHGRGIGGAMLQEALARLPAPRRIRLQVNRFNTAAWKFYQKHGFTIEQAADFDIGNGWKMEDYVMEKLY